jgi:maleylpyruvate isomerase
LSPAKAKAGSTHHDRVMYLVHAAHRRLSTSLVGLSDSQVRQPSLLPDWTVGHVLAHIALNAEAFVRVASDVSAGRQGVMYPQGTEGRNADIQAFAKGTAEELRAHIERACSAFESAWLDVPGEALDLGFGVAAGMVTAKARDVTLSRLREVEVHHADAGLPTFGYLDWSDGYVDLDLPLQMAGLSERLGHSISFMDETGVTHLCGAAAHDTDPIATTRRGLLAWLLNRAAPPELPVIPH